MPFGASNVLLHRAFAVRTGTRANLGGIPRLADIRSNADHKEVGEAPLRRRVFARLGEEAMLNGADP